MLTGNYHYGVDEMTKENILLFVSMLVLGLLVLKLERLLTELFG